MTFALALHSAIQSVKVTNWPSPPATPILAPDSVAVSSMHAAWWTFGVTVVALVAAVLAAIKAFEAVEVARRDAKTNSDNLELLQAQLRQDKQRPFLMVQFDTGQGMSIGDFDFDEVETERGYRDFELQVRNDGERQANLVTGHILVRANICTSLAGSTDVLVINGVAYRSAQISASDNFPVKTGWRHLYGGMMVLDLRELGEKFDFLVKLRDEFGETYPNTPTGALIGYAALQVRVKNRNRGSAAVAPPTE